MACNQTPPSSEPLWPCMLWILDIQSQLHKHSRDVKNWCKTMLMNFGKIWFCACPIIPTIWYNLYPDYREAESRDRRIKTGNVSFIVVHTVRKWKAWTTTHKYTVGAFSLEHRSCVPAQVVGAWRCLMRKCFPGGRLKWRKVWSLSMLQG
jgi:hypothetical protein